MSIETVVGLWNSFFHTPEPPTTIVVFRILFGLLILVNGLLHYREASLWLGQESLLSVRSQYKENPLGGWPFLGLSESRPYRFQWILSLQIVAAICLIIGLATRCSAAVIFFCQTAILHRNPLILHSGDSLLRIMAFLLIFSPARAALSVDVVLESWLVGGEILRGPVSPWCLRLMQLQVSILYWRAFTCKLNAHEWLGGDAVYYPNAIATIRRIDAQALLRIPAFRRAATWSVLVIEFALGPLIWIEELRYPVLILGILFHLILEIFMNLQLFGWTMITCLLLFVRPEDYQRFLDWLNPVSFLG